MNPTFKTAGCLAVLLGLGVVPQVEAQSVTNLVVLFATTNSTRLNPGFAGFSTSFLPTGVEYGDTNLQQLATTLSPGWLRYPSGTASDAFDWSTGLTLSNWVTQFVNDQASNLCQETYQPLLGKGGAQFTNFASMAANVGGAKIVVCVNAFTDSPQSASNFAAFALSNHIPVAAWELCNEPYLFKGTTPGNFFTNGTDYANQMRPFRDAIKSVDPNAVVALFFCDPAVSVSGWDNLLAKYSPQYWDAVVYHHYPRGPTNSTFADLMTLDNGVLATQTVNYVTDYLMPKNTNANVTYLITELNPVEGDGAGGQYPPTSTLYGGIFAAEYVMRMSSLPQMSYVGIFQLQNGSGIDATNEFRSATTKAFTNNYVTNTVGLPFGYFLSAQGCGEAVAYWALNRSTAVYATSVGDNGPTVPVLGGGTMPAIFAQAYQGGNGKRYVLLTNKGSNAQPVQITQDGVVLTNQFLETFVTGSDPSVVNTTPPPNNVSVQAQTAFNPVTVPSYSVVRLEWTVFNVPRPSLAVSSSGSAHILGWLGLTNVTYAAQATTNLGAPWSTLGLVSATRTNFVFTNWSTGGRQFYRLTVP